MMSALDPEALIFKKSSILKQSSFSHKKINSSEKQMNFSAL
jgi:hypothetical protein